jgi:epoxide hydrolase-like predicted phosphatase
MLAIAEYETAHTIPIGYINYAIASSSHGVWQKLERGEISPDAQFFAEFTTHLKNPQYWTSFHERRGLSAPPSLPSNIDGEKLFWSMIEKTRRMNVVIVEAVRKLRSAGLRVAALTNDWKPSVLDHHGDDALPREDIRTLFDVWVGSSEVQMRKPEERIYREAMRRLGVLDGREIVFLDDTGINLKAARALGWRTIKVDIGREVEAVKELGKMVGVPLGEEVGKNKL